MTEINRFPNFAFMKKIQFKSGIQSRIIEINTDYVLIAILDIINLNVFYIRCLKYMAKREISETDEMKCLPC